MSATLATLRIESEIHAVELEHAGVGRAEPVRGIGDIASNDDDIPPRRLAEGPRFFAPGGAAKPLSAAWAADGRPATQVSS